MKASSLQGKGASATTIDAVPGAIRRRAEGVGLQRRQRAVGADDLVFVARSGADAGQENFPHAAVDALAHLAAPPVPIVEIADDGNAPGVGRPDREVQRPRALMLEHMRAEPLIKLLVRAFDEQIIVERTEQRAEGVRIMKIPGAACISRVQHIGKSRGRPVDQAFEKAVRMDALQRGDLLALGRPRMKRVGAGNKSPDHETRRGFVQPKNLKGSPQRAERIASISPWPRRQSASGLSVVRVTASRRGQWSFAQQ